MQELIVPKERTDKVTEIIAYEMKYNKNIVQKSNILCIPFELQFFQEYMKIYNECFYEMRKSLDIEPCNFLNSYEQVVGKVQDIYLYVFEGEIVGSIACYSNEIDDLIVNKKFQHRGYGKQLLLWGMNFIRRKNHEPIILHVAKWNEKAVDLYMKTGFEIVSIERVR